jgi:crotonobetainyl-CoA:carnitine CoA-transferase CaiB-like acyl-CoA transferase
VLHRLVAQADGLIENNLAPNIEKLGITWEQLSAINPNLILVRMPAFGITGPYRGYRTWGNHMEALTGHTLIRTYGHVSPEYAPNGVPSDAAGGVAAALGFMLGLRQRRKTGKGVFIESATAENFVSFLGEFVLDYSMNGRTWEQMGNDHMSWAPHNVYPCAGEERWVTIAVRSDAEWAALCEVMRQPELASDPRFAEQSTRHANRAELDPLIAAWTEAFDPYWVMYRLQERGIAAGVVMSDSELLESRHHEARGYFQEIDHPESGRFRHTGRLWHASKTEHPTPRHAPLLGQDNEYVYKTLLGFTDEEYRAFEEAGHIGMDYPP